MTDLEIRQFFLPQAVILLLAKGRVLPLREQLRSSRDVLVQLTRAFGVRQLLRSFQRLGFLWLEEVNPFFTIEMLLTSSVDKNTNRRLFSLSLMWLES